MEEKYMKFGDFMRKKRLAAQREIRMADVGECLGVSMQLISEIENNRRPAFQGEKLEKLAKFLELTEEETALMYDLAGRQNRDVPYDIEGMFMYEEVGEMARYAMRQTQAGFATEEDWKTLIRQIEANKAQRRQAEDGDS